MTDAQKAAMLYFGGSAGVAIDAQVPNTDVSIRPGKRAKGVKAFTKSGRPVFWSEIRLRNPHTVNPECDNLLRRQCHHEFEQFGLPEQCMVGETRWAKPASGQAGPSRRFRYQLR